MNNTAIHVDNLGKLYRIGSDRERNQTLREAMTSMITAPWRSMKSAFRESTAPNEESDDHIWALKNVSFEVKRGEVVGIIGRNGAGKSTLLKILARITEPTEGRVVLKGRVGSLLEVGTGFHSELTGEENIYLSGTILGMSSKEISNKFDKIVAFAEMEKFINTPVKHYSSGMYMRLAFAVAAHLEPEILLVDEVLAVGDAQFQKKCLGKMDDIAKAGRTVLFVSHNMSSVKALCTLGIHLSQGHLWGQGPVEKIVSNYLVGDRLNQFKYQPSTDKTGPHIRRAEVYQNEREGNSFKMHHPIIIDFEIETRGRKNMAVSVVIQNDEGVWVHHSSDEFSDSFYETTSSLRRCTIPSYALAKGKYVIDMFLYIRNIEVFESIMGCVTFDVEYSGVMSERITGDWKGLCGPGLLKWEHLDK